jgi:hypothetical protein
VAGFPRGVQGPGDLPLAQAGLAGRGGQGGKVGGRVGVQGPVGGPEQARVAVPLLLAGDPSGQVAQVPAGVVVRLGKGGLPLSRDRGTADMLGG